MEGLLFRSCGLLALSAAISLAGPRPAAAQVAAAPGEAVQEVVVTAQKREQRLQDVPLAVTALSSETLAQAQIGNTDSLTQVTTSLTFAQGPNVSNTNFRIRGVGTAVFGQGIESSVAVVLDGVGMARQAQNFSDLADIDRVEVLRGPQGTLFGKNATAGVINVVTKRPSREFGASARFTLAEGDEYRAAGTVTGPITNTNTLSGRFTAYYNDIGGHILNSADGKKVNGQQTDGLRARLLWQPGQKLDVLLTLDYRERDAECCSTQFRTVTTPTLAALIRPTLAGPENDTVNKNASTFNKTRQASATLEANYDLGGRSLTSISAFQRYHADNNNEADSLNTPVPIYLVQPTGALFANYGQFDINGGPVDLSQFSQEIRIASPGEARLTYVAGLYYLYLDIDRGFQRRQGRCAPLPNPTTAAIAAANLAKNGQPCPAIYFSSTYRANTTTNNFAGFGQAEFKVVDALSLIAGARLQRETVTYKAARPGTAWVPGDTPLLSASSGAGSTADTDLSGKLGVQYRQSRNLQAYVTWTRGYKGKGYEIEFPGTFENGRPIEPETVEGWEGGVKSRLFGGRLRVDLAVFSADYKNLQVQANRSNPDTGVISNRLTNAGSSKTEGFEAEFTLAPIRGLTIRGGTTYLDTAVTIAGLNCYLGQALSPTIVVGAGPGPGGGLCYQRRTTDPVTGVVNTNTIQDLVGATLPNAPKWRSNLSARYEAAVPSTELVGFIQVSLVNQSKVNFTLERDPFTVQKAYTTVDASVGVGRQDGRYRLSVFVKNLTDQSYATAISRSGPLTNSANPQNFDQFLPKEADRFFGATLDLSF